MMLQYLLRIMLLASLNIAARGDGSWWDLIPNEFRQIFPLVLFLVNLLVLAVVLYLAGLMVVGGRRARFFDAIIISLLGTVLSTIFFLFIPYPLIALVLSILAWLFLIKSLYETGWLGATAVGILAIIIFLAVTLILALVFGILDKLIERFLPLILLTF